MSCTSGGKVVNLIAQTRVLHRHPNTKRQTSVTVTRVRFDITEAHLLTFFISVVLGTFFIVVVVFISDVVVFAFVVGGFMFFPISHLSPSYPVPLQSQKQISESSFPPFRHVFPPQFTSAVRTCKSGIM